MVDWHLWFTYIHLVRYPTPHVTPHHVTSQPCNHSHTGRLCCSNTLPALQRAFSSLHQAEQIPADVLIRSSTTCASSCMCSLLRLPTATTTSCAPSSQPCVASLMHFGNCLCVCMGLGIPPCVLRLFVFMPYYFFAFAFTHDGGFCCVCMCLSGGTALKGMCTITPPHRHITTISFRACCTHKFGTFQ